MPWLHSILPILENNLDILSEISLDDGGGKIGISPGRSVGNTSQVIHASDFEVINQLQRGIRVDVRDAVHCISLFPIDVRSRVCKNDGPHWLHQSVMVRALWVRSRPTCCKVPTDSKASKDQFFYNEKIIWFGKHAKMAVLFVVQVVVESLPYGSCLVQRPCDLSGGPTRDRTGDSCERVPVVKNSSRSKHSRSETRWDHNIVILRWLVSCDQDRVRLA